MRADSSARILVVAAVLAVLLAGAGACGRRPRGQSSLRFEDLPDTAGLSRGAPILTSFQAVRITGNALLVRGTADLPDGTNLQIKVLRIRTGEVLRVTQVTVRDRAFESGAIFGTNGPPPPDSYRFELLTYFDPAWQPASVLRATHDGFALRGPGITRSSGGQPAFFIREETRL